MIELFYNDRTRIQIVLQKTRQANINEHKRKRLLYSRSYTALLCTLKLNWTRFILVLQNIGMISGTYIKGWKKWEKNNVNTHTFTCSGKKVSLVFFIFSLYCWSINRTSTSAINFEILFKQNR